jgi:1,4-dihydroxy-6-naphthoate synthase
MTEVPYSRSAMRPIRLAFSPDSDDIFMFWALLAGKVDTGGLAFEAERADTEALNARAASGELDVVAVSVARWPAIADSYVLMKYGMSVGRGYGPVLVADGRSPALPEPGRNLGNACALASLEGKRIGVPGLRTTAYLVLRLLLPRFEPVVIPISPFTKSFDALRSGEVDAALLIHEGRLTYVQEGLAKVCDIGEEWARLTGGLPLPLGGNALRRGLGDELVTKVARLCRTSIAWALEHRDEAMDALLDRESRPGLALDRAMLDRYLAMYANADTLDPPEDVTVAIDTLYARAFEAGLLDKPFRAQLAG